MMKKIIFIISTLLLLGINNSYSQNNSFTHKLVDSFSSHISSFFSHKIFEGRELVTGFSVQEQDRRLFQWPGRAGILKRETSTLDYEFSLYLREKVLNTKHLQFSAGLGYSRQVSVFSRPYAQSEFGILTKDLRYIGRYSIYKVITPIDISLSTGGLHAIRIGAQAIPSISFARRIRGPRHLDGKRGGADLKFELKPYSLEINPFVSYQLTKKWSVSASYRWWYIQRFDKIIFFRGLFRNIRDPEFLHNKTYSYKLTKVWLSLGYSFK